MWCDKNLILKALEEDLGKGDITAQAVIPKNRKASAKIICKEEGVLSGSQYVNQVFNLLDPQLTLEWFAHDGELIKNKQQILLIEGNAKKILAGERLALNLLQHLSGVATQTHYLVKLLEGTLIKILDTRKTFPLWRKAQKEAVLHGGGKNHRFGLFDRFLIKENHIAAVGSLTLAVQSCKKHNTHALIEVETTCLAEVEEALNTEADIIMLDNFPNSEMLKAAKLIKKQSHKKIEVSGNITKERILQIKDYPIDYISVGALTHSVKALDFSLLLFWANQ